MKEKDLFELTQKLRMDFPVAFANYKCDCSSGVGVFDSKTQKLLFRISIDDKRTLTQLCDEVVKQRNKLSRQIATLKKATLKQ